MRNPKIVIGVVSVYLLLFTVLGQLNADISLMLLMFSISPIVVVWMVYTVLRYGIYPGKELKENEEWGYEDFRKD